MDANYAEGPWECVGFEFITDAEEKENLGEHAFKAVIRRENKSTRVSIFEANLISAAPELLEACESMIYSIGKTSAHNIQKCGLWPDVDAMNAAIAKAKGT